MARHKWANSHCNASKLSKILWPRLYTWRKQGRKGTVQRWCCMAQGHVHTAQPSPWDRSNILTRQQPGVVLWWWHMPGCAQEADPQGPSCRDQTQIHSDYIHLTLVTSKAPDFHKKPGSCSSWMSFPPHPIFSRHPLKKVYKTNMHYWHRL